MATVEKITISLTKDVAALIREAVNHGEYASTSEVIRDALRDWKLKRATQQEQLKEIRRMWRAGIKSGSAGPLDMEAIKREAKEAAKKVAR